MERPIELCLNCKWRRPISGGCEAFPDGIPNEFSRGIEEHREPVEGQRGEFVFKEGDPFEVEELEKGNLPDEK